MSYIGSDPIPPNKGGTGILNLKTSTITIGGALSFTGAFTTNFNLIGNTNLNLPLAGTLATTSVGGSGTGVSSFVAFAPIAGGTTTSGPLQSIASVGTAGQVLTSNGAGALASFQSPAASGTVTTVSVVTANGFAGTVANASSTPAITLTTSITGLLSGNGTAISGSSLTQHAILLGGASNAVTSLADVAVGQVLVSGGVSSDPAFSATPSVTSITLGGGSALGTYVTGTWTPNLQINGSNTGITYTTQTGTYTQIGNTVTVSCYIILSSKGVGSGTVTISNFPVAAGSGTFYCLSCGYFTQLTAALYTTLGCYLNGSAVGTLNVSGSAQAATALIASQISNTFAVIITGSYSTA